MVIKECNQLGSCMFARRFFKTKWIRKDTASDHHAVNASCRNLRDPVCPVCNVAIADDKRIWCELVAQPDHFGDFFPAGWYFAHFFGGAGMNGQGCYVLSEQKAGPFLGNLFVEADTS